MERLSDNTPWALKLQEVTLPDAGEGWKSMAAVLDKELPAERKRRRWWLLLILLLPLAAVSGYLGWRTHQITSPVSPRAGYLPAKPGTSPFPANGAVAGKKRTAGNVGDTANERTVENGVTVKRSTLVNRDVTEIKKPVSNGGAVVKRRTQMNGVMTPTEKTRIYGPGGHDELSRSESELRRSERDQPRPEDELRRSDPGHIIPLGIAGPNLRVPKIAHSNDPLKCPPVEKQKTTGLVVGVGLNQSIPVDGQQFWFNSSGGLNTWWKDYIPVPFVRYYFRPKLFLQAEVRIRAPQFTPKDAWFAYKYNDTNYLGSIFIKKLFYFQLPVTIHYAFSPDWSVGLGLQYSHYGKGITATSDSGLIHFNFAGPLSDYPMVFVRRDEFRGLVSVDYTYRHWIIGMSFDEAFTKALSVRVPDPVATPQATVLYTPPPVRNSSLQLYVRYILWDGRQQNDRRK
jgi:hypothetical protein